MFLQSKNKYDRIERKKGSKDVLNKSVSFMSPHLSLFFYSILSEKCTDNIFGKIIWVSNFHKMAKIWQVQTEKKGSVNVSSNESDIVIFAF